MFDGEGIEEWVFKVHEYFDIYVAPNEMRLRVISFICVGLLIHGIDGALITIFLVLGTYSLMHCWCNLAITLSSIPRQLLRN